MKDRSTLLELLRHVVESIVVEAPAPTVITQTQLDESPFARARLGPGGYIGILRSGGPALAAVADFIFEGSPTYQRGATFEEISNVVFETLIGRFHGRAASTISDADLIELERIVADWFQENSAVHRLYIPCILTPWRAPGFSVGSVRFCFLEDFVKRKTAENERAFELQFKLMVNDMLAQRAFWMAEVDVAGCLKKRAEELGELAVDIAISALQLIINPDQSRHMSRLTARTVPRERYGMSHTDTLVSPEITNQEPGRSLGPGTLERILANPTSVTLTEIAPLVQAFISGSSALPTLHRAWADAAYWYHEGLAEPLDTIAVTKLETCIEVLLYAESSKGSEQRIKQVIEAFYGLTSDQPIAPGSQITVQEFAKGLVRDRSRILHGTWSTLIHSLRASRNTLEYLSAGLLSHYARDLAAFASHSAAVDSRDDFLTFAKTRRADLSAAGRTSSPGP